jgi:hypothetical protein
VGRGRLVFIFALALPALALAQAGPRFDTALPDSTRGRLDGLRDGQSGREGQPWQYGTCCLTPSAACLGAYIGDVLDGPDLSGIGSSTGILPGAVLGCAAGGLPAMCVAGSDPAVPASRLFGRSPEYAAAYTESFRESRRSLRMSRAIYGWQTGIGIIGIGIGAALLLNDW